MLDFYNERYKGISSNLPYSTIFLSGKDALDYIHRQTTNDVKNLKENRAMCDALLNERAQLVSYFFTVRKNDCLYLLVPRGLVEKTIERLNKYIIMEDVELTVLEDAQWLISSGLIAKEKKVKENVYALSVCDEFFVLEHKDHHESTRPEFFSYLALFGFPVYREDIHKEVINNTSLINCAVSFNKGCFLGQETVGKIQSRRGAGLSKVILELEEKGEKELGDLTTQQSKVGKLIGKLREFDSRAYYLADLKREYRVEGKKLDCNGDEYLVKLIPYFKNNSYYDKAIELYDEALNEYTNNDNSELAIEYLKNALLFKQDFADAYESLGVIYGSLEQFQTAIDLMNKLLEVDDSSVMAHTNMSLFLMKQGKIEEAEEQKSLATIKTFNQFGKEAEEKNKKEQLRKEKLEEYAKREKMFLEVLDLDPEDAMALCGLGEIKYEASQYGDAIKYLESAIASDEKYSVAYLHLGKSLLKSGNIEEAKKIFNRGVSVAASKGDMMPANEMQALLNSLP